MAGNMSIPEWNARNKDKKQASLGELMAQNKGKKTSSIGGLKARNNGRDFENIIDITCRMYKKKGFGFIQKTPEPMSVIKNNGKGQFTSVFEKKAQPDYTGVLNVPIWNNITDQQDGLAGQMEGRFGQLLETQDESPEGAPDMD